MCAARLSAIFIFFLIVDASYHHQACIFPPPPLRRKSLPIMTLHAHIGRSPPGAQVALGHRVDCVIAMGGAAVIDAGKAIAAIAYADKDFKGAVRRLLAAATESR